MSEEQKQIIEIKRWDTGEVIHSGEFDSVKYCLEDGVRKRISFYLADLTGAMLNMANLTGAMLNMANLTRANLTDARLTYTNLTDARLNGADLTNADLTDANLTRTNLTRTNLTRANLTDARLTDARLNGADLTNADLGGVWFTRVGIGNATGIIQFGPMDSSGRIAYFVNHGDKVMVKAGCFWGTSEKLRKRVKDDPKRWDYLLACEWAEKRFLGG